MPQSCNYTRQHLVLGRFNDSSKTVTFTIQATTSDYERCYYPGPPGTAPTASGQRCTGANCYPQLVNRVIQGVYQLDTQGPTYRMDLTVSYPYVVSGPGGWSDPAYLTATQYAPILVVSPVAATAQGTQLLSNTIAYTLTSPQPFRPADWFVDYRPTIVSIDPPFGPEEGGTVVTVTGTYFSSEASAPRLRSLVLSHDGEAGQPRECCATTRLSATQMTCRLPRVSCLSSNPTSPCPKPGRSFVNQTVSLAIRPEAKGYAPGSAAAAALDAFVQYEGDWELIDEDVYGGVFVSNANRVQGEQYILNSPREQAVQRCCPVCPSPGSASCRITIAQAKTEALGPRPGVYLVTIPAFMRPPTVPTGPCDASTNYVNATLTVGIELSTDPKGFTPASPLSATSCVDMAGPCRSQPRVSLRETCKQLVWSTGSILATLPVGQTVEVYTWLTDSGCDRRMRCVGGPCLWTSLASTAGEGRPKLQRRAASAQIGLQVAYPNAQLDPAGFLVELAKVVLQPGPRDARRLQPLAVKQSNALPTDVLGTTFAVRETFRLQPASLCIPDAGFASCTLFSMVIYLLSDGPGAVGSEAVAQAALYRSASSPTGDPKLRMLGVYMVCFDQSNIPLLRAAGNMYECVKVQYPGFIQMDAALTRGGQMLADNVLGVRVQEIVWAYADIAVTRTGGSDLGVTVDYRTVTYNRTGLGVAKGLGVDFFSKVGQLRWLAQDTATKHIIVPIRADGIAELNELFEVWIYNVVNGSMANDTQRAVVTIVGVNNWPEPLFISTTLRIIGAVCGAATVIPCSLFMARLVRSVRREMARGLAMGKEPHGGEGGSALVRKPAVAAGKNGPRQPHPVA